MSVTLLTGKSATFSYDGVSGSMQITSFTTDQTADSETVETLAGSAALSAQKEYTATVSFLFDGTISGATNFYKAVQAAYEDGLPGAITFAIGGFSEDGDATVTGLTKDVPADAQITCEATFLCTGMTPTYPA